MAKLTHTTSSTHESKIISASDNFPQCINYPTHAITHLRGTRDHLSTFD